MADEVADYQYRKHTKIPACFGLSDEFIMNEILKEKESFINSRIAEKPNLTELEWAEVVAWAEDRAGEAVLPKVRIFRGEGPGKRLDEHVIKNGGGEYFREIRAKASKEFGLAPTPPGAIQIEEAIKRAIEKIRKRAREEESKVHSLIKQASDGRYSPSEYIDSLKAAGYEIVRIEE